MVGICFKPMGIAFPLILLYCCRSPTPQRSPVILIPGDGGSRVQVKIDRNVRKKLSCSWLLTPTGQFFTMWVNLDYIFVNIQCLINTLKLTYDKQTRQTRSLDGVDTYIPGWGDPQVVEYLNPDNRIGYFDHIINMLVNDLRYVRNVSIRAAPYDFRRGPSENAAFFFKLKKLVEETYTQNHNQPVTLISHSLGGPMTLIFLQHQTQTWKDKYINAWITLSAVWGGAVKALKVFAMGDDLGKFFLDAALLKQLQITTPSSGFLLPSQLFWRDDEILVCGPTRNYTFADMRQFLMDIDVPNGWEFRKDNEKFRMDFRPPGVELHCLHGADVKTTEKLRYTSEVSKNSIPELIKGDGDGSVNIRSLKGCKHWAGEQAQKIHYQQYSGVNHMDILQNKAVLDHIKNVLKC